ncbi:MAG: hypothetical protein ITG07_02315 [Candidimonas sp.]|nr:hypothetical protein [Candidimonas sp.]
MITFVTDQEAGEPDILTPVALRELRVLSLQGAEIHREPPPEHGWTHPRLQALAALLEGQTQAGADAFLGDDWVGSTEV